MLAWSEPGSHKGVWLALMPSRTDAVHFFQLHVPQDWEQGLRPVAAQGCLHSISPRPAPGAPLERTQVINNLSTAFLALSSTIIVNATTSLALRAWIPLLGDWSFTHYSFNKYSLDQTHWSWCWRTSIPMAEYMFVLEWRRLDSFLSVFLWWLFLLQNRSAVWPGICWNHLSALFINIYSTAVLTQIPC